MLALRIEHFGLPSVLQLQTFPEPILTADEVLVQIEAAGINPSDIKNVSGNMQHTTLPRTPGRDFAGVVVDGAPALIGTEVWGTGGDIGFTRDGSHADYIVLPKAAICPKPQTLSITEAGSIGLTYVTAWLCLTAAQLSAGETLLVIGATGGVGSAAMQIAKWQGAQVIGTVRKDRDRPLAQQNGADTVINLTEQPLPDAVKADTDGKGAAVIVDTVGGAMVEPGLQSLRQRGRLVEISAPAKERRICFDLIDFYHQEARLLGVDSRSLDAVACAAVLRQLAPGFASNALRPPAAAVQTYPLEEAIAAYEQVLNRTAVGRVALTPLAKSLNH